MGKLFVLDGTDGSGKQTQLKKLQERLEKENIEYKTVSTKQQIPILNDIKLG